MTLIHRLTRTLDPLHGLPSATRQDFACWYRQTKLPQVRQLAFLTMALYLVYALIEQNVAQDQLGLRLLAHGLLVPLALPPPPGARHPNGAGFASKGDGRWPPPVLQGSAVCFFNTPIWMTEKRTFSASRRFFIGSTNNAWRPPPAPLHSEVLPPRRHPMNAIAGALPGIRPRIAPRFLETIRCCW